MEDDQRLNTLVHEGDALRFSVYHCKKPENRCSSEQGGGSKRRRKKNKEKQEE